MSAEQRVSSRTSVLRVGLLVLATLFAAASFLYAGIWMYLSGQSVVDFGVSEFGFAEPASPLQIKGIREGSAAAQAGLRTDDQITAVKRQQLGCCPSPKIHPPESP